MNWAATNFKLALRGYALVILLLSVSTAFASPESEDCNDALQTTAQDSTRSKNWTPEMVSRGLRALKKAGLLYGPLKSAERGNNPVYLALKSAGLDYDGRSFYRRTIYMYGTFDNALKANGYKPRWQWTPEIISKGLKALDEADLLEGTIVTDQRGNNPVYLALKSVGIDFDGKTFYKRAQYMYGTFEKALKANGLKVRRWKWTQEIISQGLQALHKAGLLDSSVSITGNMKKETDPVYLTLKSVGIDASGNSFGQAARSLYGTFEEALKANGFQINQFHWSREIISKGLILLDRAVLLDHPSFYSQSTEREDDPVYLVLKRAGIDASASAFQQAIRSFYGTLANALAANGLQIENRRQARQIISKGLHALGKADLLNTVLYATERDRGPTHTTLKNVGINYSGSEFAALAIRYYGTFEKALAANGIQSPYWRWKQEILSRGILALHQAGLLNGSLHSSVQGPVRETLRGVGIDRSGRAFARAVAYHYGSFEAGLQANGINGQLFWNKETVLKVLKEAHQSGLKLNPKALIENQLNFNAITKSLGYDLLPPLTTPIIFSYFDSWTNALDLLGLADEEVQSQLYPDRWTRTLIVNIFQHIYTLHENGVHQLQFNPSAYHPKVDRQSMELIEIQKFLDSNGYALAATGFYGAVRVNFRDWETALFEATIPEIDRYRPRTHRIYQRPYSVGFELDEEGRSRPVVMDRDLEEKILQTEVDETIAHLEDRLDSQTQYVFSVLTKAISVKPEIMAEEDWMDQLVEIVNRIDPAITETQIFQAIDTLKSDPGVQALFDEQ